MPNRQNGDHAFLELKADGKMPFAGSMATQIGQFPLSYVLTMAILGAHQSIAGGYYKAVHLAQDCGCDCVQVFTKQNARWAAKPITPEEGEAFASAMTELGISHPLSHASYLINLGSPDQELWQKSVDALIIELQRADVLSIPWVVFHPGSFTTSTAAEGLANISRGLNEVIAQTEDLDVLCLLENTAGQGSNLGWDFAHLRDIVAEVDKPERIGVCIDTCHAFAAGHAMDTPDNYEATMQSLDDAVGLQNVRAFHLNDSKGPFGCRKDRHEHIGEGEMGLEPFRLLLHDERFTDRPMYLETPKGDKKDPINHDARNLATLRGLL